MTCDHRYSRTILHITTAHTDTQIKSALSLKAALGFQIICVPHVDRLPNPKQITMEHTTIDDTGNPQVFHCTGYTGKHSEFWFEVLLTKNVCYFSFLHYDYL